MIQRPFTVFLVATIIFLPVLHADVTVKSFSRSGGFQGFGAGEGTTTRALQGDKAREDNQFKFNGKMMRLMAGEKNGTQIIRVDLDKIWQINFKNKTYTQTTISIPPTKAKNETPSEKTETPSTSDEKPTHRIKKTDVSVKKTGVKKTINGFPTEETEGRLLVEIEEIATGDVTSYLMLSHFWTTPWTKNLKQMVEEEAAFQKSYMAKLGVNFSPKDREMFGGVGLAMMLGVGDKKTTEMLNQLKEKTKDLKGFPIVTESEWSVTEDPKAVARKKDQAKTSETDESLDLSGSPQDIAGNMFGSFAKKKMKAHNEAKAKEQENKPVFSAVHEVQAVETASLPASTFEIPDGFKLKK